MRLSCSLRSPVIAYLISIKVWHEQFPLICAYLKRFLYAYKPPRPTDMLLYTMKLPGGFTMYIPRCLFLNLKKNSFLDQEKNELLTAGNNAF